jgi:uncharacterized protein (DUF486 family)
MTARTALYVAPLLLVLSNVFMTYAWYGHLRDFKSKAIWIAILASWGVAFFEYCLQVPANRIGFGEAGYSLAQLKVMQEVITMTVFAVFAAWYMKERITLDFLWAGLCLAGAAYFMFRAKSVPA